MSESRPRTDLILPANLQRETEPGEEPPVVRVRRPLPKAGPLHWLALLLLTLAAFWPLLLSPVLWTGYDQVERGSFPRLDDWTEAWHPEKIRQRETLALTLDFAETALPLPPPTVHRSINIALHLAAAFLLLANLQALHMRRAFFAALLFAVHPAAIQTLFWPGYRAHIIGLLFILGALFFGVRNRGTGDFLAALALTGIACLAHPAGYAIPFVLALVVLARNRHPAMRDFNRALPFAILALLVAIGMAGGGAAANGSTESALETFNAAGLNLMFYFRQAILPFQPALFHPYESLRVGSYRGDSFLPFLFFIPVLILIGFNFRKPWARALLLGTLAYLLLAVSGLFSRGFSLGGAPALEDHGQYVALPAIIALAVAGGDFLLRKLGNVAKPLWFLFAGAFFLIAFTTSIGFAYEIRNARGMWTHVIEFWPEEWPARQALAEYHLNHPDEIRDSEKLAALLNFVLDKQPEKVELRMALARLYAELRQWTNAIREYQRVLRESDPPDAFIREAAGVFRANGMLWEARNALERAGTAAPAD